MVINKRLTVIVISFIVVVMALLAVTMWRPRTIQPIHSWPVVKDTVEVLPSNIRVEQWELHYRTHPDDVNMQRREFYYPQIKRMFMLAGFSEYKAGIYAEIPSIESDWKATAQSPEGALGLWQFMARTAAMYGVSREKLLDPYFETQLAISHIKDLDSLMKGDVAKVLFSYNGGLGVVNSGLAEARTRNVWLVNFANYQTYSYAPKVLGLRMAIENKNAAHSN